MKGLLCFVFILSTILIGCLFLNKDVEAFTPYRMNPVIIKLFTKVIQVILSRLGYNWVVISTKC